MTEPGKNEYQIFFEAVYNSTGCGIGGGLVRMCRVRGIGDSDGLFTMESLEGMSLVANLAIQLINAGFVCDTTKIKPGELIDLGITLEIVHGSGMLILQDPQEPGELLGLDAANKVARDLLYSYLDQRRYGIGQNVDSILEEMAERDEDTNKTVH